MCECDARAVCEVLCVCVFAYDVCAACVVWCLVCDVCARRVAAQCLCVIGGGGVCCECSAQCSAVVWCALACGVSSVCGVWPMDCVGGPLAWRVTRCGLSVGSGVCVCVACSVYMY